MVHLDNPVGFREVVEEHLAWVTGPTGDSVEELR